MRVLVIGATGLIGSAVAARLAADGHEVVGLSRHPLAAGLARLRHVAFDLTGASSIDDLVPLLVGVTAVVNCRGTLQSPPTAEPPPYGRICPPSGKSPRMPDCVVE